VLFISLWIVVLLLYDYVCMVKSIALSLTFEVVTCVDVTASRPLSTCFRLNYFDFPYILFCFLDQALPFPFQLLYPFPHKTKVVRVFSQSFPSSFIPSHDMLANLLPMILVWYSHWNWLWGPRHAVGWFGPKHSNKW